MDILAVYVYISPARGSERDVVVSARLKNQVSVHRHHPGSEIEGMYTISYRTDIIK